MPSNKVYISSISGGKCLQNTQAEKGECRLRKWTSSNAQQWIVETSTENPREVAFQSITDKKYLAALQPDKRNGGKIGVQEEKQWWTLEAGRGPGWFHVKSNSSFGGGKAGYLNDEWGRWQDDNKIQTYQFEENNPGFNTFYFSFTEAADSGVLNTPTPVQNSDSGGSKELKSREEKLAQREKELTERDQKLTERDEKLGERDQKLTERDQALTKRDQNLVERDQQLTEREQSLKEREVAAAESQGNATQKTGDDQATASAPANSESNSAGRARALDERESLLAKKEAALEQKAGQPEATTSKGSPRADDHEACRLQRENDKLRLELKIKDLEQQLRQRACTHNVKRPPRKIDHKVIGYVYP